MASDLIKRVYEHKNGMVNGFTMHLAESSDLWSESLTKQHGVHCLVWYETHETPEAAILREKQIKKWERKWKLRLIGEKNPEWKDLYKNLL